MSADPQALVVQAVQALEACTASVRALEKSVDRLDAAVSRHHGYVRDSVSDVIPRVDRLAEQVQRSEDRADRADQAQADERVRRWDSVSGVVRGLWGTAEVRLLIVIAVAGWLGVRMDLIQVMGAP